MFTRFSILYFFLLAMLNETISQTNPIITSWLQNTTVTARHYVAGNSTPINDASLVNCQRVQYDASNVYIATTGLPSYVTGPFLDGNPSIATNQNAIFKFPLTPVKNTVTPTSTTGGNIGLFINGVALFDYRDGVAWNNTTMALCGGPGNPPCPGGMAAQQAWNRDAIPAERSGFDCNKAHPAMGNYHHHQNPSTFDLDIVEVSNICNLYDAEGLYTIDITKHSPLIGYAYDGFPIYGAYALQHTDGTGPIVRMKSSYTLRTGTTRLNGPNVSTTYPLGYFREDYIYVSSSQSDYLDEHNGRICITPEYPDGIYCYFTTVDENFNSAYPYVVGPSFYGTRVAAKVTSVPAGTFTYLPSTSGVEDISLDDVQISVFPNPSSELIILQVDEVTRLNLKVELVDISGKVLESTTLLQGSTMAYFDTKALYSGQYFIKISNGQSATTKKVIVVKE